MVEVVEVGVAGMAEKEDDVLEERAFGSDLPPLPLPAVAVE